MSSSPAARPLLWPLVPAYRLGLALRELQFRSGLKPVRRLKWPVVSVGNLSAGGAGKTPLTIALAKALTARGLHIDVLSRGYGRSSTLPLAVNPDGAASEFGDEPLVIAREANVPVYVATERYDAGLLAERDAAGQFGIHLLDDGFQHRQLARDVNILLLDGTEWSTEHLLPAGNLREPFSALRRATVVAVTAPGGLLLEKWLRSDGRWQGPIWRLRRFMEMPPLDGPAAAFCGIARPDQFFQGIESAGVTLVSKTAFADHHKYTAADLARVDSAARKAGATTLFTTEKDRIRIGALAAPVSASLPIQTVPLRIEIENEKAAIDWLIHSLKDPA